MARFAILQPDLTVANVVPDGSAAYDQTPPAQRVALGYDEWCEPGARYRADQMPRFVPDGPFTWTAYQFLGRFTVAELDAIRAKSQTDSTLWRFLTFATAAQEINSDDPTTLQGMDYLVALGIISAARREQILTG